MRNEKELRELMGAARDKAKAITAKAESEKRGLTDEEIKAHKDVSTEFNSLMDELTVVLADKQMDTTLAQKPGAPQLSEPSKEISAEKRNDILTTEVANIFSAVVNKTMSPDKKMAAIHNAQKALSDAGHYRNAATGDNFNTLIDPDGGIFLPTTVSDQVFDIARQYGAFAAHSNRFPTGGARIKIPNVMGELEFMAVNENAEILVDKFLFKALELDDLKWALFVPWSNELEGVRGAQLVSIILNKLGQAYARLIDAIGINADGTAAYHNIKGLVTRSGEAAATWVRKSTATATRNTFAKIESDDWLNAMKDVAPGARNGARYLAHPNRKIELLNALTAASAANPVKWVSQVGEQMFVHNTPIDFSESFPNVDGSDKPYAALVNYNHVAVADRGNFTTELFDTGEIKTKDGKTINLLSQDGKALRVKAFVDLEFSPVTITDDAGAVFGSFTVLYTA